MGGAVAALVERSHFEGNTAAAMAGAVGLGLRCAQVRSPPLSYR